MKSSTSVGSVVSAGVRRRVEVRRCSSSSGIWVVSRKCRRSDGIIRAEIERE